MRQDRARLSECRRQRLSENKEEREHFSLSRRVTVALVRKGQ